MKTVFSNHAEIEMLRRNVERKHILSVVKNPQQKFKDGNKKWIYQSKYFDDGLKKEMLLRIFAEEDLKGIKVITTYKTSKISKYWKV